jgi:hypothetical protein
VKIDVGHEKDIVEGVIWEFVKPLMNGVEKPVMRLWEEHLLQGPALPILLPRNHLKL